MINFTTRPKIFENKRNRGGLREDKSMWTQYYTWDYPLLSLSASSPILKCRYWIRRIWRDFYVNNIAQRCCPHPVCGCGVAQLGHITMGLNQDMSSITDTKQIYSFYVQIIFVLKWNENFRKKWNELQQLQCAGPRPDRCLVTNRVLQFGLPCTSIFTIIIEWVFAF